MYNAEIAGSHEVDGSNPSRSTKLSLTIEITNGDMHLTPVTLQVVSQDLRLLLEISLAGTGSIIKACWTRR